MIFRILRYGLATIMAGSILACAAAPRTGLPPLHLPPQALGQSLDLVQQLTLDAAGQQATLDILLEIEPEHMHLAALALGQRVMTIGFDGQTLSVQRAPQLPEAVDARQVLRDMQLLYWPEDAIAAALPTGWQLQSRPMERLLFSDGQLRARIRYTSTPPWLGRAELDNLQEGYRLTIESTPNHGGSQ